MEKKIKSSVNLTMSTLAEEEGHCSVSLLKLQCAH